MYCTVPFACPASQKGAYSVIDVLAVEIWSRTVMVVKINSTASHGAEDGNPGECQGKLYDCAELVVVIAQLV